MPTVLDTRVICKQPDRYIGWPTVGRAPDGVLYALFSGDREAHVDPFGKSFLIRSADEGQSWSSPEWVNDTPMDDRDTGLCIHPDGTLIMSWFTSHYYGNYALGRNEKETKGGQALRAREEWAAALRAVTPELADRWAPHLRKAGQAESRQYIRAAQEYACSLWFDGESRRYPPTTRRMGFWTRRSTDGGRTWDTPTPSRVSAPHGPNVLPNGDLIYIGTMHEKADDGGVLLGVAVSADKGVTWNLRATVNGSPENADWETLGEAPRLCEPHVVAAASGKLIGLARCQVSDPRQRGLWQFDSTDHGQTWTEPRPTNLLGFPPHLLRLRDGRLMVSHAIRHQPPGQRFCFSNDEGESWDVENQLTLADAPSGDLGYPASAELADGTILSVYYQREQLDEKPCLMQTRWRP